MHPHNASLLCTSMHMYIYSRYGHMHTIVTVKEKEFHSSSTVEGTITQWSRSFIHCISIRLWDSFSRVNSQIVAI